MNIAIFNRFSKRTMDYHFLKSTTQHQYTVFTRTRFVQDFEDWKVYGYEDYEGDARLILDFLNEHKKNPFDLLVSTHEFDIERAGKIREMLKIPGQSLKSSLEFRDKYQMKQALKGAIDFPFFDKVKDVLDILRFVEKQGYPVVIKPRSGAASVGISVLRSEEELSQFFKKPLPNNLMIETFCKGEMFHVDGLWRAGKLLFAQPSEYVNTCLSFEENVALGSVQLSVESPFFSPLIQATKTILKTLETPENLLAFHAEFFIEGETITFCEIGSRVGGGMIQEATKQSSGIDLSVEGMYGQLFEKRAIRPVQRQYAGWVLVPPKVGVLKSIQLSDKSWITDMIFDEKSIGQSFKGGDCSVSQIVAYTVVGKTPQEVKKRMNALISWQEEHMVWAKNVENV